MKHSEPLVSVVIPVYNVENYLTECIESIQKQTYKNIEIILVDDGSQDNCPKVCDEYAARDTRIKVIHQTNKGLSAARNTGVEFAHGRYITFIDSDDWVDKEYIKVLLSLIQRYCADIAIVGMTKIKHKKRVKKKSRIHNYEIVVDNIEALEMMLYQKYFDTSACSILLPIETARLYPFPVGRYHEDDYTTYKYLLASSKIAYSSRTLYFYLQREKSIMHEFDKSCLDEITAIDELEKYITKHYPQLIMAVTSKKFSNYCQIYLQDPDIKINRYDIAKKITAFLFKNRYNIIFNKKTRIKNKLAAIALCFGDLGIATLSRVYQMVGF